MNLAALLRPLLALDGVLAVLLMTEDGLPVEMAGRELAPDVAAAELAGIIESARGCFRNLELGEPASVSVKLPRHEVMIFAMARHHLAMVFAPHADRVRAREAIEDLKPHLLELFGEEASLRELLQEMLEVEGVTGAALMNAEGEIVDSASKADANLELVSGLVAGSLASGKALRSLLGDDELASVMIEYEHGAILVTPLATEAEHFSVLTLGASQDLKHVRLKLHRLLEKITKAVNL